MYKKKDEFIETYNPLVSIITPTFNRKKTLGRTYASIKNQTYKNIEWIVIDDGSDDNTKELVESWINDSEIQIKYAYQNNSGKHIAVNRGLDMASGEYVSTLDSDDAIEENAIELLLEYWNRIPEKERNNYKSITGRVKNGSTGELIGKRNSWEYLDCTSLDARFKYHLEYEKWGLSRLAVLNEFRSPNIKGLHFYPENIVYDTIARKYKERFVEDVVRLYFLDSSDSIIRNKGNRCNENYYLWKHNINDVFDYFKYNPLLFIKSAVGMVRDGLLSGRKVSGILNDVNTVTKKMFIILFLIPGAVLYEKSLKKVTQKT